MRTIGLSDLVATTCAALQTEIERGRFAGVERLPGERDLAATLSVSRTTLRKAMAALIAEGLVDQRQGYGTYVARGAHGQSSQPMTIRSSPVDLDRAFGQMVYFGEVLVFGPAAVSVGGPSPDEATALRLAGDERIWRRLCPVVIDGRVVAIETTAIPLSFVKADIDSNDRTIILDPSGHAVVRISQRLRAVALDRKTAVALGEEQNTNGFYVERSLVLSDRRCLAFRRVACHGATIDCLHDVAVGSWCQMHGERPTG